MNILFNTVHFNLTIQLTKMFVSAIPTILRTRKDIDYPYGLDLGLSNGWDTDTGPSEMDPQILDEVFQRFLKRTKEGPEIPKIKTIYGLDSLLK